MANSGTAGQGSSSPAPKILLAKPGLVAGSSSAGKFIRGAGEDDSSAASIRSRLPPVGSLNLLSDSWDFHFDRFLPVPLSLSLPRPLPCVFVERCEN